MILISRAYKGYVAGSVIQLSNQEEASLVAQGLASVSVGPVTPGAVSTTNNVGRVGIAAAGQSVVISNPLFTTESKFLVNLSNAAADATATYISRVIPANGSVTITLNAAATGVVAVDWLHMTVSGLLPPN